MDTSTEIKFECGDCGQRILVDAAAAGMNVDCPCCRASVLVPKIEAAKRHRDNTRRASGAGPKRAKSDPADQTFADPEISSLRQELVEASTQITHAEGELDELRAQLAAARADADRFQASAHSAQAENKSERLALRNEVAQLKQKLELERAEADQARAETNGLTGELTVSQHETETVRQQLRDREIEFAEICTGLAELQAERTASLRENQALTDARSSLDAELSTVRASLTTALHAGKQLQDVTHDLAAERALHAAANEQGNALGLEVEKFKAEAATLRRSISESASGRALIETRDQLAAAGIERDRLAGEVRQLREDARKHDALAADLTAQLKTFRCDLDEARRAAEAQSESRLQQDNAVLRGIVERQNAELAQKHAMIVKFKRARLALRLVYAVFALALIAIGVIAVKYVPALRF
jgi:chromosome segregation ATPase